MAPVDHSGVGADRLADQTCVNSTAAGLQSCAQKCIRRYAEVKALRLRRGDHLLSLLKGNAQRLFRVHMLSRMQRRHGHVEVIHRPRQIQDDFNGAVIYQIFHILIGRRDAVLFFHGQRALIKDITHGHHLQLVIPLHNILKIDPADIAETDNSHIQCLFHFLTPFP